MLSIGAFCTPHSLYMCRDMYSITILKKHNGLVCPIFLDHDKYFTVYENVPAMPKLLYMRKKYAKVC